MAWKTKKLIKLVSVILTNFNFELYFETQFFVISMVDYPRKHTYNGKKNKKKYWSRDRDVTLSAKDGIRPKTEFVIRKISTV